MHPRSPGRFLSSILLFAKRVTQCSNCGDILEGESFELRNRLGQG